MDHGMAVPCSQVAAPKQERGGGQGREERGVLLPRTG